MMEDPKVKPPYRSEHQYEVDATGVFDAYAAAAQEQGKVLRIDPAGASLHAEISSWHLDRRKFRLSVIIQRISPKRTKVIVAGESPASSGAANRLVSAAHQKMNIRSKRLPGTFFIIAAILVAWFLIAYLT